MLKRLLLVGAFASLDQRWRLGRCGCRVGPTGMWSSRDPAVCAVAQSRAAVRADRVADLDTLQLGRCAGSDRNTGQRRLTPPASCQVARRADGCPQAYSRTETTRRGSGYRRRTRCGCPGALCAGNGTRVTRHTRDPDRVGASWLGLIGDPLLQHRDRLSTRSDPVRTVCGRLARARRGPATSLGNSPSHHSCCTQHHQ